MTCTDLLVHIYARAATYPPDSTHRRDLATVARIVGEIPDPGWSPRYRAALADCAAALLVEVAPDMLADFLGLQF